MHKLIVKIAVLFFFISGISAGRSPNASSMQHIMQIVRDTTPVKIEIENKTSGDMNVLFVTDTAASTPDINRVLGKGYGEIMEQINKNKLQPLKFMAWYYSMQPPWPMEIAIEVNTLPAKVNDRVHSKVLVGGAVVIAHMWGPYDQVGQAYKAIEKWLKENNRRARSAPFEVYINDPATVKSASEIRTDVYQPLE